jgi:hypothetical protein
VRAEELRLSLQHLDLAFILGEATATYSWLAAGNSNLQ